MGFDYRIYSNHSKVEEWQDGNGIYWPIYKSFDILDAFMLDTLSSGRMLVDKREIGLDQTYLTFNDEMWNFDALT